MDRSFVLKYLNPIHYLSVCYENKIRPDTINNGRKFDEYRKIGIICPTNNNLSRSCFAKLTVNIGNTSVLCGVSFSVGTPDVIRGGGNFALNMGEIAVNVNIGPIGINLSDAHLLSNSQASGMSKSDEESHLQYFLYEVIARSDLVDLKKLCIVRGQHAFRLEINIVVLCNDGNLFDASVLAMVCINSIFIWHLFYPITIC